MPSKAKRWPALTSATGEVDCDEATMSGIEAGSYRFTRKAASLRASGRGREKTYYKIRPSFRFRGLHPVTSRLFALIPCAGTGSRSGAAMPKQYRTVAGRDLLHYTLAAFDACNEFAQTLVVIAPTTSISTPGVSPGYASRYIAAAAHRGRLRY